MSFPFNALIPQSGDNPSVSQGEILQNFTSLGDTSGAGCWTNQDHYPFQTGTDGQHKQVRLPSNNVPAGPPFVPTIFTNNDAFSVPQLFYYTGTAAQSSNQYYPTAANGSTMLLGGIILKWGLSSSSSVSFTQAFPNACFTVVATAYNGAPTNVNTIPTKNGFTTSGTTNFFWIAIGN